jgi:UDP-2,3-diacylglucosamine hydrolase
MCLKLKDGAIFIADAHYPHHKQIEFLTFLQNIKTKKIKTPQLFLMGDIFDLLIGKSKFTINLFKNEIKLLEEIAKDIEVIYLEGNHDFYLKPIFKRVKVIPLQNQPLILKNGNLTYALTHGDKYNTTFLYKLYTKFIRNALVLSILPETIAIKNYEKMKNKKICKKIKNFESKVGEILKNYSSDFVIEGHYHQEKIIKNYIALPSFGCSQKVCLFLNKRFNFVKL